MRLPIRLLYIDDLDIPELNVGMGGSSDASLRYRLDRCVIGRDLFSLLAVSGTYSRIFMALEVTACWRGGRGFWLVGDGHGYYIL